MLSSLLVHMIASFKNCKPVNLTLLFILITSLAHGAEEVQFMQITGAVWEDKQHDRTASEYVIQGLIVRDKSGEEIPEIKIGDKLFAGFRVILPEELSITFRTYADNIIDADGGADFLISNLSPEADAFILRSGHFRYQSKTYSAPLVVSNQNFFTFSTGKSFDFNVENENKRVKVTCFEGKVTVTENRTALAGSREITGLNLLTRIVCRKNNPTTIFPFSNTFYKKFTNDEELMTFLQDLLSEKKDAGDKYGEVNAKNNIGVAAIKTGQPAKAIPLLKEAYKDAVVLKSHILLSMTYNNLGQAWHVSKEFDKAINYYNNALNSDINITGKQHPRVAEYLKNLGISFQVKRSYGRAVDYLLKAIAILSNGYGDNNHQLAEYFTRLGQAYFGNQDFDKAITYYKRALESDRDKGEHTASVATRYNVIGLALKAKKEYASALEYYEKGLNIALKLFGEKHPKVAIYYNNIGLNWFSQDDFEKALPFLKKGLNIDKEYYGSGNINVGIDYNDYASALHENEEFEKALQAYKEALLIFQNILGEHHRYVKGIKKKIKDVKEDLENSR